MKFDLSFAGFILSLVVTASGWFFRWNDKKRFEKQQDKLERQQAIIQAEAAGEKRVNEIRDFNHLLGNQKQISEGITTGFKDIEEGMTTGFKDIEEKISNLRELMLRVESYLIRNQGTKNREE
ncbi:hypothetical protein [uncultured Nostoc sp.]|uniref:hypothetical protein n=1 Tax=uncultured Nostoc sp. TaxID=340711 RepID=UPI0035CBE4B1